MESGACHWSFGSNAPKVWVAYRELFTPRLGSSADSGERRRREGPSGPTNWLVLMLERLENHILFPVPLEPDYPREHPVPSGALLQNETIRHTGGDMPRGRMRGAARRKEMQALRYERLCHDTRERRRDFRAREAALALRKATPDWVELDTQLKQHRLEAEMEAMVAAIDASKPDIPILNFDLMPGFQPPLKQPSKDQPPKEHPDVAEQKRLNQLEASIPSNENSPPPPGGKNWKYDSTIEDRDPAHDWRNWE